MKDNYKGKVIIRRRLDEEIIDSCNFVGIEERKRVFDMMTKDRWDRRIERKEVYVSILVE